MPLKEECLYAFTNAYEGNAEGNAVEKKIRDQYSAFVNVKCYSTTEVCRRKNNKKPIWFVIHIPLSNRLLTVRVVPMPEENIAFVFHVHNWNVNDMGPFGMIHCGCCRERNDSSLVMMTSGLELKGKEESRLLHVHRMNRGDGNNVGEVINEPVARANDAAGVDNRVYQ